MWCRRITPNYSTIAPGIEIKFLKVLTKVIFIAAGIQITNDAAGYSKLKTPANYRVGFEVTLPFIGFLKQQWQR